MQLSVKDIGLALLRVVLWCQISLLFRTIRRIARPRIVDPADDVIEVCFLSDPGQIRGKRSAKTVAFLAYRVTSQASPALKDFFAMIGIALLLFRHFAFKAGLPQIRCDGLDFVFAFLVFCKAPERRHLRSQTKLLRVF